MVLSLFLSVFAFSALASDWTWEDLVNVYGQGEEYRQAAEDLREVLLDSLPSGMDEKSFWEELWTGGEPRRRAALSLGLVECLFPNGDPRLWDEVQGFWRPAEIPRSLAALDAVFVAALSLLEMDDYGAKTLALNLIRDLSRSPRARYHALFYAPREYETIVRELGKVTPPLPVDHLVGTLPLARSVRGSISQDAAVNRGVTFLDSFGGIAQGSGAYAWDRSKGRIYRVRDGRDRIRWLIRD